MTAFNPDTHKVMVSGTKSILDANLVDARVLLARSLSQLCLDTLVLSASAPSDTSKLWFEPASSDFRAYSPSANAWVDVSSANFSRHLINELLKAGPQSNTVLDADTFVFRSNANATTETIAAPDLAKALGVPQWEELETVPIGSLEVTFEKPVKTEIPLTAGKVFLVEYRLSNKGSTKCDVGFVFKDAEDQELSLNTVMDKDFVENSFTKKKRLRRSSYNYGIFQQTTGPDGGGSTTVDVAVDNAGSFLIKRADQGSTAAEMTISGRPDVLIVEDMTACDDVIGYVRVYLVQADNAA